MPSQDDSSDAAPDSGDTFPKPTDHGAGEAASVDSAMTVVDGAEVETVVDASTTSADGAVRDLIPNENSTLVDPLLARTIVGGGNMHDRHATQADPSDPFLAGADRAQPPVRTGPVYGKSTRNSSGANSRGSDDLDGDEVGGRYVLIGVGVDKGPLGQGAFGEVWQAHDGELNRQIALKILKPRMCRPAMLLRFELEKEILARMEHPNIARVFEGGTFADGRPFLAMELIRGRTLTAYCNDQHLTVAQRLRLFVQICRAVHHAHERFVLHRDLKPSNIMVVDHDGAPVPKVIDFGIAKVLEEGEFSADAAPTQDGSIKGTPAYMSPEQTHGDVELTVRSDIYTLGVILYELLTGDTPLSHDRTRAMDLVKVISAIRSEEPVVPSASVTQRDPTVHGTKLKCGLPPIRLSQHLRGDLDVIVLHALEKEPARRYESAADLAADLERHLANEPIQARPPGTWYRTAKFVRRHRVATAAAAIVLLALVSTAAVSTWSYFSVRTALDRESVARQTAVAAEKIAVERKQEAEAEREKADMAKRVAEQKEQEARISRDAAIVARSEAEDLINYMLFDLREQLEPLGRSRLLASVSEKAEQYFSQQPAATDNDSLERNRAIMFSNRGRILLAQGEVDRARAAFQRARDTMKKRLSEVNDLARRFDLAMASYGLGLALRAAATPDEARPLFEEFLPFLRTRHAQRDVDGGRLLAANLEQLGELQLRAGKPDAALTLFREQEKLARELRASAPQDRRAVLALAIACEKVAEALQRGGRIEEALPRLEEEVTLLRALSSNSLDDLMLRRSYVVGLEKLGNALLALKRPGEARKHFDERLREAEILSRVDPRRLDFRRDLAVAHQRLASALLLLGRNAEALDHARTDLQLTTALASENPLNTEIRVDLAASQFQVGLTLLKASPITTGKIAETRECLEQAAEILRPLAAQGKIDERSRNLLAELEKTLQDLAEVQRNAPFPRRR